MKNVSKLLFLMIMVLGTTLTLSSETWLGMWMGLEMNLIAFIPILYKSKNSASSESCMIYFLVQSLGSILMLIAVLNNSLIMMSPNMIEELFNSVLVFSMLIKLGMPPFHFWFPEILEKMDWAPALILMTWQKIAPLTVLSYIVEKTLLMPVIIIVSSLIGAIGGLNQTSIRKIMAYSSINHMSWMVACMKFSNEMWIKYLVIYSTILIMMIYIFNYYSSFFINQLTGPSKELMEKLMIITLFLSLGGLPPFLGFLPKWMVIQSMIISGTYMIMVVMIMLTLITLFYYLRLISTILLISCHTLKWNKSNPINKNITLMMISINLALPVFATFSF